MYIHSNVINPMHNFEKEFEHFELSQLGFVIFHLYFCKHILCSTSAGLIGSLTLRSLEVLRVSPVVSTGGGVQAGC